MGVKVREKIKGSGHWYVFINHNGRKAVSVGDKDIAEEVAKKISAAIVLGQFNLSEKELQTVVTFFIFSKTWMEDSIKGILSDSTYERYGQVLVRDVLPYFGEMPLDKITVKDVSDFIKKLIRDGRSTKSISLSRTVLSSCLSDAVIEGIIPSNPVKNLNESRKRSTAVEKRRPKVHKVNPFKNHEVKKFIDFVMHASPEIYGPMFLCDFRTGLRLGELIALHWSDIDWENGRIHVQRAFRKGKTVETKDGEDRYVDISSQLQAILTNLLKLRKAEFTTKDDTDIPNIIFHYKGWYRAQNTVRKAFKTYLKKAGLRIIRVHDMRHTYASQLLSNGASLAYVKEQLGHSSIKTTVDIYGHLVPNSSRSSLDSLDSPISLKLVK